MRAYYIADKAPANVLAFSWNSGDPYGNAGAAPTQAAPLPDSALSGEYKAFVGFMDVSPEVKKIPGLIMTGANDQRFRSVLDYVFAQALPNSPWAFGLIPNRAHQYSPAEEALDLAFFEAILGGAPLTMIVPSGKGLLPATPAVSSAWSSVFGTTPVPTPGPTPNPVPTPTPTPTPPPPAPTPTPTPTPTPGPVPAPGATFRVQVSGTHIVRADDGTQWMGRGANIPDLRGCDACTYENRGLALVTWKKRADALFRDWGATFCRLTLESYATLGSRVHGLPVSQDPAYLDEIEAMVKYVGDTYPNVQLLVTLFLDPSIPTTGNYAGLPSPATVPVWQLIATRLAKYQHVWFGCCNEPQSNYDGSWDGYARTQFTNIITAIRAIEAAQNVPPHIITVQGTGGWARLFTAFQNQPLADANIVYERHVYEAQSVFAAPLAAQIAKLPTIIGEWGPDTSIGSSMAAMQQLLPVIEAARIPWAAWTFHQRCPTTCSLLVDNSAGGCGDNMTILPSTWGQYVKDAIAAGK
jgi:hypothetical protein